MRMVTHIFGCILTLLFIGPTFGQINQTERFVQIRSINFSTGIIELHNFGQSDIPLDGWRFCSHDESENRRYTQSTGFNGITLSPAQSLFIHFNNDAQKNDKTSINRSDLGGSFATPLDTDGAYSIQLYYRTPFGTGANIADHLQASVGGIDNLTADERSDEAEVGGVWADQSTWINISENTESVVLLSKSAQNELNSPLDYQVNCQFLLGDINCDGIVSLLDVRPFVDLLSNSTFDPSADINGDGLVSLLDVGPFVLLLTGE